MTGLLLVTHAHLGETLIETVEFILGKRPDNLSSVSIDIKENPDALRKKIKQGITKVKSENGVLILTDMFGGTPSNLSYSFLDEGKVEVISGVNLPIVLKAVNFRKKVDMEKLTASLVDHGKKSITLASGILKGASKD
ncbi:MAG: PTS fructose transporter subunit IIA [Desulfobacteraceae bacterium]|nr:PTS fructose transporter subunit IIA [Desulfobacteraceae bacterium]